MKFENVISIKGAKKNPDSFIEKFAYVKLSPKKDKGTNGIYISPKAIAFMGMDTTFKRVVFVRNYQIGDIVSGTLENVLYPTNEDKVKIDKVYKSAKLNLNTRVATSNDIYNAICEAYNLDNKVDNYLIVENSGCEDGDSYKLTVYSKPQFNEGKDVSVEFVPEEENL